MGEDFFHREILHLCKSKGECAYLETKEQFEKIATRLKSISDNNELS